MKEANLSNKELQKHGDVLFPIQMYYSVLGRDVIDLYLHWHSELEIIHIKEGSGRFTLDFVPYEVSREAYIIVNSGVLHEGTADDYMDCETLVFDLHTLMGQQTEIHELNYIQPMVSGEAHILPFIDEANPVFPKLNRLFSEINTYEKEQLPGYELLVKSALFRLIHLFFTENMIIRDQNRHMNATKLQRISTILDYVDGHYREPISTKDMAMVIGVTEHYFCHFYKEVTGGTFKDYLNRYRIQQACQALRRTDQEVIDIAGNCGFENLSYFYRQFKKYKGMSPGRFRKAAADK